MKKQKWLYKTLAALAIVSFIICSIFIYFLPSRIPTHYNFNFDVDQMGSKYTIIIFPIFVTFFGVLMGMLARREHKLGHPDNEFVVLVVGILGELLFILMMVFYTAKAFLH